MDRFRRTVDDMTPTQRTTLGILVAAVFLLAVVAVVVSAWREPPTPEAVATSTTGTTPQVTSSTTTPSTTSTTTTTTITTTTAPTTTTTVPPTTTTTIPAVQIQLVLRPDGVGEFGFGDPAEQVFGELAAILGDPDEDTGWVDQQTNYGICLGDEVRFARWGSFQAFFTDGPSDWGPGGVRHFASYTQAVYFEGDELPLVTADGLALGSPVGDVRAIYGQDSVFEDPIYGPVFLHDPSGPAQQWGSVSGLDADDTIRSINGSYACGE